MAKSKNKISTLIMFLICIGTVFLLANIYLQWALLLVGVIALISSCLLYFFVFGFSSFANPESVKKYRTTAIIFSFLAILNSINYFNGITDKLPFLLLYWFVTILYAFVYFKNRANRIH